MPESGQCWLPTAATMGIVSEADLVREKARASGASAEQVLARSVMSTPVMTIDIAQSAHEASDLMAERGIRHPGHYRGRAGGNDLRARSAAILQNWGTV